MTAVRLDILSDPVCPWCYLGRAALMTALDQVPDHPFTVEWHPFQLNPDMPPGGMDRRAYLVAKFVGEEAVDRAEAMLIERAAAAGVPMRFDLCRRAVNTIDAHRLIHWAGLEGRQDAVVSGLFAAYFAEGRDISDAATLTAIGAAAGMDPAVSARLLAGDADRDLIRARDAHSRRMGVNAVPTFIVGQRHAVQGAQPVDVWLQVIRDLQSQATGAQVIH
jgi:predicted DsbA family dithiol-disulfide isomerase